jgi:hypothetical protein
LVRIRESTIGNGTFMISTFVPLDDHALIACARTFLYVEVSNLGDSEIRDARERKQDTVINY